MPSFPTCRLVWCRHRAARRMYSFCRPHWHTSPAEMRRALNGLARTAPNSREHRQGVTELVRWWDLRARRRSGARRVRT